MLRCRAICDEPTVRRIEHYILAGEGYVEKITFMHQKGNGRIIIHVHLKSLKETTLKLIS